MSRFIASLMLAFVLVMIPSAANAEQGCIIDVLGIKVCGTLVGVPLPEVVTVTVRPDPIIVPGPTQTVTVTPPTQTHTVTISPDTEAGETKTVTESAVGPTPDAVTESATATATVTVSEGSRQDTQSDGIIEPDPARPNIDFGDGKTTIVEAGIGLLTLMALLALLLLTLYGGYILGYKDKESKDTRFMRALLEQAKVRRGKHS